MVKQDNNTMKINNQFKVLETEDKMDKMDKTKENDNKRMGQREFSSE